MDKEDGLVLVAGSSVCRCVKQVEILIDWNKKERVPMTVRGDPLFAEKPDRLRTSKTRLEVPVREGMILVLLDNAKTIAVAGGPAGNGADEVFVAELDDIGLGRGVFYVRHM